MPTRQAPLAEQASKNFISTRNACKLCAPLGASIVYRGIEGSVPLIHGSQGCATYIRRYVISHFKEPIDIASSNVSEEGAIFGGGNHLQKALDNIARQYRPKRSATTSGSTWSSTEPRRTALTCRSSCTPRRPATGERTWTDFMKR